MIDFNWTEILILGLIGIVMFGPEKLPDLARQAARIVSHLRRIGEDARGQLRNELGPSFDNISLADLNPKTFVTKHILSEADKQDLLSIRDELRSSGEVAREALNDVRDGIESAREASRPDALAPAGPRVAPFDPEST